MPEANFLFDDDSSIILEANVDFEITSIRGFCLPALLKNQQQESKGMLRHKESRMKNMNGRNS